MGRDWDGDGEEIPPGLWDANYHRALKSKRGQKFLREIEAALLAMQAAGNPRLMEGGPIFVEETEFDKKPFYDNQDWEGLHEAQVQHIRIDPGQVCILGAVALHRGIKPERMAQFESDSLMDSARFGAECLKQAWTLSCEIARENDRELPLVEVEEAAAPNWETSGRKNKRWVHPVETPEARFIRMLAWVQRKIVREEVPV